MLKFLRQLAIDITPVRASRDFRLISIGGTVSALGAQAVMVALPYQIYVISHSATLVGLLGAFELGPMIVVSLIGGAIADRRDRRQLLAVSQIGVIIVTAVLFLISLGHPAVLPILLLGGLLAGCSALNSVATNAIVPNVLGPEMLRAGIAFNYGVQQAASIVGPGLGGLVIAVAGPKSMYLLDAVTSVGMLWVAFAIAPQPPHTVHEHPPVMRSIADGLRFVVSNKALAGSFLIDINAMMFGMPRALFAALSLSVYHAGASGVGLLYAGIAVGGTVSVFTSGWVQQMNRLGRATIVCVIIWGAAIGGTGLVRSIVPAVLLLAVAGWADGISAICRSTISQTVTPDRMRGRMGAVFSLVVTSGPRLGDLESGLVAGLTSVLSSVLIGGLGCLVGVGVTVLAYPQLAAYDAESAITHLREDNAAHAASLASEC